ncbi:MFS transporter [Parasphingopyxis algicola]|uniref:MFS transporter n=1 Tax=Parasphingopyxis algicola TaxID=2026624 RepID=UPI0015A14717|nr:MFS transporter [Parasphingopyxis algicola]QLC26393.1 MFS transporter [Parasphingopyxis algicola]
MVDSDDEANGIGPIAPAGSNQLAGAAATEFVGTEALDDDQGERVVPGLTSPAEPKLNVKTALGWAFGSTGTAVLLGSVNTLLLIYIVDHLLLSATLAGTIISATRLFDAVIDPLMGSISDQTRSRWGRRRPYLLIGGILCALSVLLLFSNPLGVAAQYPAIFVTVALCFYAIAYTVYAVPYITMSYELTGNPKERTLLMSYRVYASSAGLMFAQALAPWIVARGGGGMAGFAMMGYVMAAIILIACLTSFVMTAHARVIQVDNVTQRPRLRDMGKALGNKPFVRLVGAKSCYLLGTGIQAAALAFFLTVALEKSLAILGLLSAALLASVVLSQPFWVWVCNRIGKRNTFYLAVPLNAGANLSWLLAQPGESAAGFVIRGILIGLAGGGMLLVIQAMLPDTLQYESERGGVSQEGVLSGVFTTIERGVSAISVAIAGLIMGVGGYVAGQADQSDSAIQALYFCVAISPAIGMIMAVLVLRGYSLKH